MLRVPPAPTARKVSCIAASTAGPHAEIIVRAPHRDLRADAVVMRARKAAAAPLQIGEDAVASLFPQRIETTLKKRFVVHCRSRSWHIKCHCRSSKRAQKCDEVGFLEAP
jgi:hypothetical protein